MWPFLLILAIVPMIFIWSDSVRELFPTLSSYLPDKDQPTAIIEVHPERTPTQFAGGEPGQWYVSKADHGFVAWVISLDGQHRLAVGCYSDTPPSLQVTQLSGHPLADGMSLNYQYGVLPLEAGTYAGPELINATAQFKDIYLQSRASAVLAQFSMPGAESNMIARNLQDQCAQPS